MPDVSPSPISPFIARLLRRPGLWAEAVAAGWAARPRRGPGSWLPAPEPRLWGWRLHTAYGDDEPEPDDVVEVLRWRRRMRMVRR